MSHSTDDRLLRVNRHAAPEHESALAHIGGAIAPRFDTMDGPGTHDLSSSTLLTPAELLSLIQAERVNLGTYRGCGADRRDEQFVIHIDAAPLARLAESAARGYRLYEFMRLNRPGDILRYLWVSTSDLGSQAQQEMQGSLRGWWANRQAAKELITELPFSSFDASLWLQEMDWISDDDDGPVRCLWRMHRAGPYWNAKVDGLFALIKQLQIRLRDVRDPLLEYEMSLITSKRHRRDYWALSQAIEYEEVGPQFVSRRDDDLFELICSLARRPDVAGISCPFQDYELWRRLVWEQVTRAERTGLAPREALFLAGPDSGIPFGTARDWGGDIHIPCEGVCEADVLVLPASYAIRKDAAVIAGTVQGGLLGKKFRWLLTQANLGEFPGEQRLKVGDWYLYQPHAAVD